MIAIAEVSTETTRTNLIVGAGIITTDTLTKEKRLMN